MQHNSNHHTMNPPNMDPAISAHRGINGFNCAHPDCKRFFPFPKHTYDSRIAYYVCDENMTERMYFCPSYDQANAKIQALKSDFASIIEDDPERRIELESRLAKLSKFVQESNFSSCCFDRLKYENYLVYLEQQKK